MIDLNKPQVLTEPVKCWVRNFAIGNCTDESWSSRWLIGITEFDGSLIFVVCGTYGHIKLPTKDELASRYYWNHCTLTDPYKETVRFATVR